MREKRGVSGAMADALIIARRPGPVTGIVGQYVDLSQKPFQYNVTVTKVSDNSTLGLDIIQLEGKYLKIEKVNEGLVQDWNDEKSDIDVKVNDYIIAVNGVSGACEDMLTETRGSKTLELTINRSKIVRRVADP